MLTLACLRAELFKLRKRTVVWLIAAVWLALTVVFGYVLPYAGFTDTGGGRAASRALAGALPAHLVPTAIEGFPLFAGALALVLGALCAGGEYGWHTLQAVLTQGPGRLSVLAGKVAALLVTLLLFVLATFAVAAVAALLVAWATGRAASWPPATEIGRGVLGGWLIVGMWGVCGVCLALLVRGTATAIGLGLAWALALENLTRTFAPVVGAVDALQRWFPGTSAGSLAAALGVTPQDRPGGTPGITTAIGGGAAALVLAAYVLAFALLGAAVWTRRDVT